MQGSSQEHKVPSLIVITIVKLEIKKPKTSNLLKRKKAKKHYSIKCTLGSESETVEHDGEGPVIKDGKWVIEVGKGVIFFPEEWSEFHVRVSVSKKGVIGEAEKDLKTLVSDYAGKDIELDTTQSNGVDAQITIRLGSDPATITQGSIDAEANRIQNEPSDFIKTFCMKARKVTDIFSGIAEINSYAKAAVTLALSLVKIFTSQAERDDNISDLMKTIMDTYCFVLAAKPLHRVEEFKEHFKSMLRQTIIAENFIKHYTSKGFGERALQGAVNSIDKDIKDIQQKFDKIKDAFRSTEMLHVAIKTNETRDEVGALSVAALLADIPYAGGMEFQESSICLPSTRIGILKDIMTWIEKASEDVDDGERVLLLTGLAGSGKSTIAHTIASDFHRRGQLGSSFFLSRSKPDKSRPELVLSTIAQNLADQNTLFKLALYDAVKDNRELRQTADVRKQFEHFIKQTAESTTLVAPVLIIIDALDECEGDGRWELMEILALEMSKLPDHFRILLTTRDGEVDISKAFQSTRHIRRMYMRDIGMSSTLEDIRCYIQYKLTHVTDELSEIEPDWPVRLTKMSGGLFIWASTVCKYISGEGSKMGGTEPSEQLKIVLTVNGTALDGLCSLYHRVLENTFDKKLHILKRYSVIMGIILVASTPLSSVIIDALLNGAYKSKSVIPFLGALLAIPDDPTQSIELLHTSFRDYLTTAAMSKEFHIDLKKQHVEMARYCLELMNRELRFNICGFEDLYILYDDIPADELTKRTKSNISEALQYACRYWPLHIVQMDSGDYDIIKKPLHRFLFVDKHLMQWIEIVSILKMMDVILKSMDGLMKWFQANMPNDGKIYRMVYDCFRFLGSYSYPITRGPLQVYHSAISYVPTKTALCDVYCEISGLEPRVRVIFGWEKEWSSLRSKLQMSDNVIAVAFSPDGARVVCVSDNGKLQVFDFATSAHLGEPMECSVVNRDSLEYAALAFSRNGSYFAISTPESIEVWSVERRVCTVRDMTFTAKETRIPIAFLSNDCVVACRVNGRRVELWRRSLSDKESAIHSCIVDEEISRVAMSPSGRFFGCLTESGNVFAWDTQSQEEIAHFKVDDWCRALGISSDGEYIVASMEKKVTMWSRARGEIIWKKEGEYYTLQIFMPLSTECGRFVTSSYSNYIWDFATGDHYRHESLWARAVSADGRYLVTKDGDIYSIEYADRPHWEPISVAGEAEANKPSLFQDEYMMHTLFLSDGSLSAAGSNGNTVFIWDGLRTADAGKQMLEGHTSTVWDAKISPDGLKLASWDEKNVLRWSRNSLSVQFELREKFQINNHDVQMVFAPDGSLILAVVTEDGNISVWEQFGTANVVKYTLETHMSRNAEVRFSPDGMKIASLSKDNNVFVSAKQSPVARFELYSTHKFENYDSAWSYLRLADPSRWEEDNTTPATKECTSPEQQLLPISEVGSRESKTILRYEGFSEWVTTADGKRLWWIPDRFRGWWSTQLGNGIVVYKDKTAILFTYAG